MKLVSFAAGGCDRIGVRVEDRVLDLASVRLAQCAEIAWPASMIGLIAGGDEWLARTRAALAAALSDRSNGSWFSAAEIVWHPPVREPSKICCLALNNTANADRILQGPSHPAMFTKPSTALIGHLGSIECLPWYGRTHPEPELAVVIGRRAKHVSAANAYDYVYGYTIHNDITSPTMRTEDTFHYRAIHPADDNPGERKYVDTWVSYPGRYKCADTFACMGPCLVTKDEVPDPHDLTVTCVHQHEVVTEDSTRNLTFKTPEVLAYLTSFMTLLPGDIVSLGTALALSSRGQAVQNVDLNRLGGPVSVSIERLGTLTNNVSWPASP